MLHLHLPGMMWLNRVHCCCLGIWRESSALRELAKSTSSASIMAARNMEVPLDEEKKSICALQGRGHPLALTTTPKNLEVTGFEFSILLCCVWQFADVLCRLASLPQIKINSERAGMSGSCVSGNSWQPGEGGGGGGGGGLPERIAHGPVHPRCD